eukprot:jgi/Mesvir1/13023/Mv06020-RA.1
MTSRATKDDAAKGMALDKLVAYDTTSRRQEYLFPCPGFLERYFLPMMNDTRDLIMVHLLFNITMISVPFAITLYILPNVSHLLGLAYFVAHYVIFLERFILLLHYSEHRKIFKPTSLVGRLLNGYSPYLLSPLFGVPSGVYRVHHVIMHHIENNEKSYDLSSTEPYQRDNLLHFLLYLARYVFAIWVELPWYTIRRRRLGVLLQAAIPLISYWAAVYALYQFSPVATTWVFLVPFCFSAVAMMFGNWSQHIFIDPDNHRSSYALTYNCIHAPGNLRTFNDGYHIVHHVNSKVHWSEMPAQFLSTLDRHVQEDALVFEGIHFFDVGIMVMTRRLHVLADRIVQIGPKKRTRAELVEMLHRRLAPIQAASKKE